MFVESVVSLEWLDFPYTKNIPEVSLSRSRQGICM